MCLRLFAAIPDELSKPVFQTSVQILCDRLAGVYPVSTGSSPLRIATQRGPRGQSQWPQSLLLVSPWDTAALVARGLERFRTQMTPVVQARQQEVQPKRRGRPKAPVVTGYLIGDDSTMHKEKGRKMEGIGKQDQYQLMSATALVR